LQAIEREGLDVYGRRGGHGVNLKIDANEFAKLKINYPHVGSPIDSSLVRTLIWIAPQLMEYAEKYSAEWRKQKAGN
jgi:hypothetical protein